MRQNRPTHRPAKHVVINDFDRESAQRKHLDFTVQFYQSAGGYDLSQVRSGHSDAAHMCDAIVADIRREHTVRGRVTKRGEALAEAVKRAGDAIWDMRGKV